MLGLKPGEILLILAVLLLLFGATRLPQLGSSMGSAIRNFKKGFTGEGTPEQPNGGGDKSALSEASSPEGSTPKATTRES